MDNGNFQNKIKALTPLKNTRYENIFKLYKTGDKSQYFYNLLQSIYLPENLNEDFIYYQLVNDKIPWTIISYNAYKTIELWWLICLTNKIYNPVKYPDRGTLLKIIKPIYVNTVLNEIKLSLK
jgi:hypothetical protein